MASNGLSPKSARGFGLFFSAALSVAGIFAYADWFQSKMSPVAQSKPDVSEQATVAETKPMDLAVDAAGLSKYTVVLQTTRGKIKFKFYPKEAPKTVERISALIQQKFYDGLTFHRVVPGFVIQGGDPTGTGMGGTGNLLAPEFNEHKHIPGAVAMARKQDLDSADCQFYISLGTHPHLDNQYTVFGQVTEGLELAQQIQAGDRMIQVTLEE